MRFVWSLGTALALAGCASLPTAARAPEATWWQCTDKHLDELLKQEDDENSYSDPDILSAVVVFRCKSEFQPVENVLSFRQAKSVIRHRQRDMRRYIEMDQNGRQMRDI